MSNDLKGLIGRAKSILATNLLGNSTKPSPHLYPHQWNWDSGFIAIKNPKKMKNELKKSLREKSNKREF